MKLSVIMVVFLVLMLSLKAQETCSDLKNDLTNLKFQTQLSEQNINARIDMINNQTQSQMSKDKQEMQNYIDKSVREQSNDIKTYIQLQTSPYKYTLSIMVSSGLVIALFMLALYSKKG